VARGWPGQVQSSGGQGAVGAGTAEVQFGARDLWRPRRGRIARVAVTMESADTPPAPSRKPDAAYHGVLNRRPAATVGRTQLVSTIDESCTTRERFSLATHRWASVPSIRKAFYSSRFSPGRFDSRVDLRAGRCASGKARVDAPGRNTTFIQYTLVREAWRNGTESARELSRLPFLDSSGDWRMHIEPVEHGVKVLASMERGPLSEKQVPRPASRATIGTLAALGGRNCARP